MARSRNWTVTERLDNILTWCCTITPVNKGVNIRAKVAMLLLMPINTPAYCGAISRWLTKKPLYTRPSIPSEIVRTTTTTLQSAAYPTTTKAVAWIKKPRKGYQTFIK